MARFSFRPRSLTGLILLGFVMVALPALLGTISAAIEMRNLSAASERLVVNGVAATQYTQALVRQVSSLERTARLYQIIPRQALLETFRQNRDLLSKTLENFSALPGGNGERATVIDSMRGTVDLISRAIESQSTARISLTLREFTALARDAGRLSNLASGQTDRELKQLQAETAKARRRLYWQSLALIPITVGLIVIFALVLARPIRQIDAVISSIGHGQLSEPVKVQGPSDLQALGRQLEWLRVRLQDIAEERNRFLRHMSHELKTPLANIREGTELLMDGAVGELDSNQREVTTILRDNSIKLQHLIENLLSFSAWQARHTGLELSEFRLRPLIKSTLETHQLTLLAQRVHLELKVEDIELKADRAKLKLILDNLLSNALKYSPRGGTIYIHAHVEKQRLVLDIGDTGAGIPKDERAAIFEAFYSGKAPQSGHLKGTGIGLSVVSEFVQAHGGSIEIVDGVFPGAHFRVRLPLMAATQAAEVA
jgi:two-component system, NtrC family, sensor histidine kinase GlrK